jgi:hypothetical protein
MGLLPMDADILPLKVSEEYYHEPSRTNTNIREDSTTNKHEYNE